MQLKSIIDEDFVNYKLPSMFIATAKCNFKCDLESGRRCCQNSDLANQPTHDIPIRTLVDRYLDNPITHAVVFGGLEPLLQYMDVLEFIMTLRRSSKDDVVIYTGYNRSEVSHLVDLLGCWENIVIKFGRFLPDQPSHFDEVLGVYLASPNQYAERIVL